MLLEISCESLEVLVVCPDVVEVRPVPNDILVAIFDLIHSMDNPLLLVFLQHLVTVVLNATKHADDKIRRLALEEPAESNNALGNCAQVVEQGRCAIRLPNVVDTVRRLVKIGHQLRVLGLGLLGLGRNEEIGTLGLEGLQNRVGLCDTISNHSIL